MGLSKLYFDPTTGKHMPFRGRKRRHRYAALCEPQCPLRSMFVLHLLLAIEGLVLNFLPSQTPTRPDDVEAIGIHGRLPWQGICALDIPSELKRIGEMKRGQSPSQIFSPSLLPSSCHSLSTVDHSYLKKSRTMRNLRKLL